MIYKYKNKNKLEERALDSTFRIIPVKFKGYKMLTISTFDIKDKIVKLCGFICYKYQDIL